LEQKFNIKQTSDLVGINVDSLNKALPAMKTIKPQKEKTPGKGRPINVDSLFDVLKFRIYQKILAAGFTNKSAAKMIESIDDAAFSDLFDYARQKKIDSVSEVVTALYYLVGKSENEKQRLHIFNKIEEFKLRELSLNFFIWVRDKPRIFKFAAGVEATSIPPEFKHLNSMYKLFYAAQGDCHFKIIFNNVLGEVLYEIRKRYSPNFEKWLFELKTQLSIDF
jgi:hypothetical protein